MVSLGYHWIVQVNTQKPRFSRKTTGEIFVKLVAFDYLDVADSCNKNCFSFTLILWTGVSEGQFRVLLYCLS